MTEDRGPFFRDPARKKWPLRGIISFIVPTLCVGTSSGRSASINDPALTFEYYFFWYFSIAKSECW
ncbi:hypothetical protein, partial [Desulfonatronospira sp.]|uniref:hypothetical protein n=1 Tax=Desulfonatronospira sp. TaxID=1962951 RepID=UPI0025B9D864